MRVGSVGPDDQVGEAVAVDVARRGHRTAALVARRHAAELEAVVPLASTVDVGGELGHLHLANLTNGGLRLDRRLTLTTPSSPASVIAGDDAVRAQANGKAEQIWIMRGLLLLAAADASLHRPPEWSASPAKLNAEWLSFPCRAAMERGLEYPPRQVDTALAASASQLGLVATGHRIHDRIGHTYRIISASSPRTCRSCRRPGSSTASCTTASSTKSTCRSRSVPYTFCSWVLRMRWFVGASMTRLALQTPSRSLCLRTPSLRRAVGAA